MENGNKRKLVVNITKFMRLCLPRNKPMIPDENIFPNPVKLWDHLIRHLQTKLSWRCVTITRGLKPKAKLLQLEGNRCTTAA
mmetsp:Transcript_53416/g.62385  ORF Transcript_53416/g.62385 Transcript_53416/m.62385 type:complete len:82 (+) Transcript_53416:572-817(+)